MTNQEWIQSMGKEDLANWITEKVPPCEYCQHTVRCYGFGFCNGTAEGWAKWLGMEHKKGK